MSQEVPVVPRDISLEDLQPGSPADRPRCHLVVTGDRMVGMMNVRCSFRTT